MNPTPPNPAVATVWVVYDHPQDHPNHFVVRRQVILKDKSIQYDIHSFLFQTLEEIHQFMPPFLTRLPPTPGDDPVIAEVWI